VAELLLHRDFEVSYETIRVWEFRFAPMVSENLRSKRRGISGRSWYLDETYIKVGGVGGTCTVLSTEMETCSIRC
jgi:transposase-like protein